jgi:hypothetical protein
MWLQIKEEVFTQIAKKAISKGYRVTLTPKYRKRKVEEFEDGQGGKIKHTIMHYTGYRELGQDGWYLVHINYMLYTDLVAGIDLGPHILIQGNTRFVKQVDYNREYIYFRVKDDIVRVANCFTQHFEITT